MYRRVPPIRPAERRGATVVEMAVVLPVFFLLLFGLFEFGHAFMVINTLKAAANQAARLGVAEGVSTARVAERVNQVLGKAIDTTNVTVYVKNASIFDTPDVDPTNITYQTLPDIELTEALPRQLFIVRVEVPYDTIAILPPSYIKGVTLSGQSVMRHE